MDNFRELLLDVWREACQHIEIRESAATIANMLAEHLPLSMLGVFRLDIPQRLVENVAQGGTVSWEESENLSPLTPSKWKPLLAWARSGKVLHGEEAFKLQLLSATHNSSDILAGPLSNQEGPAGALVITTRTGQRFSAAHARMLKMLLDPFSAALENDRRLHELTALREAAEADRRSLLTRLGRQEMTESVVGADTGLRQVMERVELVAKSDVPVLILGDTGTGKEVVARAIHNRSSRSAAPFIRVNCGAIPAELIDSHLFGHEKGSFTGAADLRQGWFERADKGTLFLDEIGELPLPAQVRLLRVLQDHHFERVGGQQAIHVDVRIVTATHRELARMVQGGTFREDLWYRINIFPILLPPLRERSEDIPALARHFAQRAAHRFGLAYVDPTPKEMHQLMNYSWPGNIRELGAVIDRAAILGNGKSLEIAASLGSGAALLSTSAKGEHASRTSHLDDHDSMEFDGIISLEAAMKSHIERALLATRGRVEGNKGAAALLGINPHTLRARMRKLGVEWSNFR